MNPLEEIYDRDRKRGEQFERYAINLFEEVRGIRLVRSSALCYQQLHGDTIQGVEFKRDTIHPTSGRFFVEVKSRWDPRFPWNPSGIFAPTDAWLYCIGDIDFPVYVFSVLQLRRWSDGKPLIPGRVSLPDGTYYTSSKGCLLEHNEAVNKALIIDTLKPEE